MINDDTLLPKPEESLRCAPHAELINLDPVGSALTVDEVMVIDVPLPWPKPVWAAAGFTAIPEAVMAAAAKGRKVRALAGVPNLADVQRVVVHRRARGAARFVRREFRSAQGEIGRLAERLLTEGPDVLASAEYHGSVPEREVLLCTQGSHDACCGSRGSRLADALSDALPQVSVRRVSHTGGHRFAPTGATFPDGRMWGFLTVAEMLAIVDCRGQPSEVAARCRGWLGADPPGQVAERALFARSEGWDFDDQPRAITTEVVADGWRCLVTVGDDEWEVGVALGRTVPTITCGEQGGLPAKWSREYLVTGLRQVVK